MRTVTLAVCVVLVLLFTGCSSYYAGTRYDQTTKQNVLYLRNTIVKKDTRGTFYLSVRYVAAEESETLYLVVEYVGKELLYIRADESLVIRGLGVDISLSQDKKRRVRDERKNEVREQSFFPISEAQYKRVIGSRETQAILLTAKQPVRFPLSTTLKVSMRRFYQENVAK